jgi:hypothetical protein
MPRRPCDVCGRVRPTLVLDVGRCCSSCVRWIDSQRDLLALAERVES